MSALLKLNLLVEHRTYRKRGAGCAFALELSSLCGIERVERRVEEIIAREIRVRESGARYERGRFANFGNVLRLTSRCLRSTKEAACPGKYSLYVSQRKIRTGIFKTKT